LCKKDSPVTDSPGVWYDCAKTGEKPVAKLLGVFGNISP
jgi:hypothetical protein